MALLRLSSVLSPYVVVLFQLSCMLSLFHAQRQVCSTPDSTINGTHNTVTGALLAQGELVTVVTGRPSCGSLISAAYK